MKPAYARRAVVIGALLLVPAGVAAWVVVDLFRPPEIYAVGEHPLDVVTGDVDGDGDLDVLTANREGRSVTVLLGDGRGGLTPTRGIEIGMGATSLALADMNADGNVDVVVTGCDSSCTSNRILIHHGLGDGTFEEGAVLPVDGVPYNVAVADFDDDGRPDIAASDYPGARLIVLLSQWSEDGFVERSLPTGRKPIAVAVDDLNDDGIPDLVSSDHGSGSSSVYLSWGGGEFSERIVVETGELPYAIALGSVDGDRLPDLIVAHSSAPGGISVLQGRGDGTFSPRGRIDAVDRLVFAGIADFDRDGAPDIVVTRDRDLFASVHLNEGDGFFRSTAVEVPANNRIYSLAVADLDGDGLPDLIAADYERNTLSVSLGKRPGRS